LLFHTNSTNGKQAESYYNQSDYNEEKT